MPVATPSKAALQQTVEEYLKGKGLQVFRAGSNQLTLQCLWHDDSKHPKGKLYVNAEHGAFNCVSGDTRMVTRKGIFPIAELVGTDVEVLSHQGWIKAPVRSFGIRQTYEVHLRRSKLTKVIRATDGHRWFLKSGKVVRTDELTADSVLAGSVAERTVSMGARAAIARGIMAGDGSVGRNYAMIQLWGPKAELVQFFDPSSTTPITTVNGIPGVRVNGGIATKVDRHEMKTPPSMEESDEYLLGWLQGYFATDGTIHGSCIAIDSMSMANLKRVQEICDRLGIVTGPIRSYSGKRINDVVCDLPRISLHRASLWPEFFIREDQRARFGTGSANGGQLRLGWKVEVVLPGRVEEVYCPVVPGAESFTLEHNLLTGNCKVCDVEGGMRMLMEHFGDLMDDTSSAYKPSRKLQIFTEYANVAHQYLFSNRKALDYLLERGLSEDVIKKAKLGYHGQGISIMDALPSFGMAGGFTREEQNETGLRYDSGKEPFERRIIIPYLQHGQAVQVRAKDMAGKYQTPAGEPVRLYNQDALRGADVVFLVEGEFDALVLEECLHLSPDAKARNIAVVAVPGTQSLPGGEKGFVELLKDATRVYIGFDTDNAGRRGANKVRELLAGKGRVIELPEEELDWTDWLAPKSDERPHGGHGWKDVMELIRAADMKYKRLFTMADAAAQLYEIENSAPALKLGYPSLDALIAPGLRPGSVTVPLARTGSGKSILLQNIMYYTRHIPQMLITLELTAAETWVRLRRIARFHHPEMTDEQLTGLYSNLLICQENQVRQEDLYLLVEEFKEEHGQAPQIGYVDYLGYYARAQPGRDQYTQVTSAIMSLKEWAKEYSLACIVPGQVNRSTQPGDPISENSARDAGPVEETADFLFGLWRPWESTEIQSAGRPGAVQDMLKLRILKSRHGNKGRTIDLSMGHHSLAIVDAVRQKEVVRVEQENVAYNRGETYDTYWKRQQQNALLRMQGALALTSANTEKAPWE